VAALGSAPRTAAFSVTVHVLIRPLRSRTPSASCELWQTERAGADTRRAQPRQLPRLAAPRTSFEAMGAFFKNSVQPRRRRRSGPAPGRVRDDRGPDARGHAPAARPHLHAPRRTARALRHGAAELRPWQRPLRRRAAVLGRTLLLDDQPYR
jgi:hypothetical protein